MKKLLLLCLASICVAINSDAKRLYVKMTDNWRDYSGGTKIYTWWGDNKYTGNYNTSDNLMTQIGSTNWYYIDADFPEKVNIIFISQGSGESWKSSGIYEVSIEGKYLIFTSDGNNTAFSYTSGDMGYYLYKVLGEQGASSTYTTMNITDNNVYTGTIYNQESPTNTEYLILPKFIIDNGYTYDNRWPFMIRPWNEESHQKLSFTNEMTNRNCGYFGNSNSWKTNNVGADFDITFTESNFSYSISPYFTRTIKSHGYSTFASDYAVAIPSGVTASYATGVENNELVMTNFTDGIPANTGALLYKAGGGNVTFTPASSTDAVSDNLFVRGNGAVAQTTGDGKTNYILTTNTVSGIKTVGFYKANEDGTNTVASTKAYLSVPTGSIHAREYFSLWEENTTNISSINKTVNTENAYYNLNGQRVKNPTKGLYIVNGKKVIIK